MKNSSSRALYIWLMAAITLATFLLLTRWSPPPNQVAHAQQTPREILVQAKCDEAGNHEHIRFGDESSHYFTFWAKRGVRYQIATKIYANDDGITVDTRLLLFRHNPLEHPGQHPMGESDDFLPPPTNNSDPRPQDYYQSQIQYTMAEDGHYWIEVQNRIPGGEGSYCLDVTIMESEQTDDCEPNDSFEQACEWPVLNGDGSINENVVFNFVPFYGHGPDQDFYKIWVKAGQRWTCQTDELSARNDTIITLYDHNRNYLGHNDDVTPNDPNDKSSAITETVSFTGWLYILVSPALEVDYHNAERYTYKFSCEPLGDEESSPAAVVQPQVQSQPAPPPVPTATPLDNHQSLSHNLPATGDSDNTEPEAIALVTEDLPTAVPVPAGAASIVSLPAAAAPTPALVGQPTSFTVQIYYDENNNQRKDADEGIGGLPVYIYTTLSTTPLEAITAGDGTVLVSTVTAGGSIRLVVPYLGINQEIPAANIQDIHLRVLP